MVNSEHWKRKKNPLAVIYQLKQFRQYTTKIQQAIKSKQYFSFFSEVFRKLANLELQIQEKYDKIAKPSGQEKKNHLLRHPYPSLKLHKELPEPFWSLTHAEWYLFRAELWLNVSDCSQERALLLQIQAQIKQFYKTFATQCQKKAPKLEKQRKHAE